MWQRAIEIGKSFPTGDGRDVIISKRSWENKHSTVLQGGKGRQEGVAAVPAPPASLICRFGEVTVLCECEQESWNGKIQYGEPAESLESKERSLQPEGEELALHPPRFSCWITAWQQVMLWEGVHPCYHYRSIWDPFQQRIATLSSLLKDGAYRN